MCYTLMCYTQEKEWSSEPLSSRLLLTCLRAPRRSRGSLTRSCESNMRHAVGMSGGKERLKRRGSMPRICLLSSCVRWW